MIEADRLDPEQIEVVRSIVDAHVESFAGECFYEVGGELATGIRDELNREVIVGSPKYQSRANWSVIIGKRFIGLTNHAGRCLLRCGVLYVLVFAA